MDHARFMSLLLSFFWLSNVPLMAQSDVVAPVNLKAEKELLQKLRSDEYIERENATNLLRDNPKKYWALLKKLVSHEDAEVQTRVRRVIAGRAAVLWSRLNAWVEDEDSDLLEFAHLTRSNAMKAQVRKWKLDAQGLIDARGSREQEMRLDMQKARTKVNMGGGEEYIKKRKAYEIVEVEWRMKKNVLETRLAQCIYLLENNLCDALIGENLLLDIDPAKLPFRNKKSLPVSFEFIDTKLGDALDFFRKVTDLNIKCDPNIDLTIPVNLRVSEMKFSLAIQWVAKLAGLTSTLDEQSETLIIGTVNEENKP